MPVFAGKAESHDRFWPVVERFCIRAGSMRAKIRNPPYTPPPPKKKNEGNKGRSLGRGMPRCLSERQGGADLLVRVYVSLGLGGGVAPCCVYNQA